MDLKRTGVILKRARYFISCLDRLSLSIHETKPENVRLALLETPKPASTGSG